ncbi:hypothetical protein Tco_0071813 [Tanacetum coccineum]
METKDTLSSCLNSEEQQMQQIQDKAKRSCMAQCSYVDQLEKQLDKEEFQEIGSMAAFKIPELRDTLIQHVESIKKRLSQAQCSYMDQLEKQLDKEEFQEIGSKAAFKVLETQFQMFIKSQIYLDDEYVVMTRNYFLQYTQLEILELRDTLIQHVESIKKLIDKRALHKREYDCWVNKRQMQTTEEEVDTSKALDARQQHTEQPKFNNEGAVDQNAEQCHDTRPLPAKLTDNQTTELSNQSLKYENISLQEGQHGQFLKVKNNEAKVKHDIDVIETINIELEHKVAKLLKENETLKRHYKELSDSIKTMRAKTIEHTTSLIAQNAEFKAQLQEKGFAIAALKNELRKLIGNSVNTKLAKQSILGKPVYNHIETNQLLINRLRLSLNDLEFQSHGLPPKYSSNDMVHNHYLEEAKNKTQDKGRNSKPSVMPSARSQSIANGSKPKPKINKIKKCGKKDQKSRIGLHLRTSLRNDNDLCP